MEELVPILLSALLGTLVWRRASSRNRILWNILIVGVCGPTATVISGEFRESWLYGLLDLGEASLGLALGFAIAHGVLPRLQRTKVAPPHDTIDGSSGNR